MEPNERIQAVLDYLDTKAFPLAIELGLVRGRINDILIGKSKKITYDVANAISGMYPTISLEWLMTGNGEMLLPKPQKSPETPSLDIQALIESHTHLINILTESNAELKKENAELKKQNAELKEQLVSALSMVEQDHQVFMNYLKSQSTSYRHPDLASDSYKKDK